MAKRLTDTDKWRDDWYLELNNDYRIIWQWLLDNCSHAGICKKNIKLLNSMCNTTVTESDMIEAMCGRVLAIDNIWFIPKFLKFQYSTLQSNKPVIVSVRKEILKYNLQTMIPQSFGNDYTMIKDKSKDKDKDINLEDKEENMYQKSESENKLPTFEEIKTIGEMLMIPKDITKLYFYSRDADDWLNKHGRVITNIHSDMKKFQASFNITAQQQKQQTDNSDRVLSTDEMREYIQQEFKKEGLI